MLVKNSKGDFARVERDLGGNIYRFEFSSDKIRALVNGAAAANSYSSPRQMLQYIDWTLVPLTLETLSIGDEVVNKGRNKRTILMAQGYGKNRCYVLSQFDDNLTANTTFTAHELSEKGYVPVPWVEEKSRNVDDVLAGLPDSDKEIVKRAIGK